MSSTMRTNIPVRPAAVIAAPRQLWLATLGAAAVTREWAEKEAGGVFRTLVREGAVVESDAIRYVGRQVRTSIRRADALARDAREGVSASVHSLASIAAAVRRRLPSVRARIDVETAGGSRAPAKVAARTRRTRAKTRTAKGRAKK
jgi:poly(hydroxyalkanoate) granule associated protein phasin